MSDHHRDSRGEARSALQGVASVRRRVTAYGPACVGNVAAGFDVLGAALAPAGGGLWGDVVEIAEVGEGALGGEGAQVEEGGEVEAGGEVAPIRLVCAGPFAHQLPADPRQNVAVKACEAVARRLKPRLGPLPALEIRLWKGLPVGSGLGSSSATVVATVRALDALLGRPLAEGELLAAAGEAEAHASGAVHLDNVAAALLGGLCLVDPAGRAWRLPFPEELCFVLAVPALTLTTREARAALPAAVPLGVAVAHAQNLGALVHALHAGDRLLLRGCLRDLLAEPYRAGLVPGFREVQSAGLRSGAWGCSLSGAGPAVFAVAETTVAQAVGEAMREAWEGAGVESRIELCTLDCQGARVVEGAECG